MNRGDADGRAGPQRPDSFGPFQALTALTASPGTRAYYDELRARDAGHDDALRRVASRLTGILHGCLKTGSRYDEITAWSHRTQPGQAA